MSEYISFVKQIEDSVRKHWYNDALSDYKGMSLKYSDVARRIAKLHILFEACGVRAGDKIAICGKNQANWGVAFLAAMTYGAVPVPILHEFTAASVHHIVNHSESRILFAGDLVWRALNKEEMPAVEAFIGVSDFRLLAAKNESVVNCREHLNELFGRKYPKDFTADDLHYFHETDGDQLAVINYTSGTSGFSKGVMLPYRSLNGNLSFAKRVHPGINSEANVVSMLPLAHMYGMMFEFLYEMNMGAHVHFLTRLPSPKMIMEAFAAIKPDIIIAVPMIIEKIYKSKLLPLLTKPGMKLLLSIPVIDARVETRIKEELESYFGGRFKEVIIGGAAFNKETDEFFHRIKFRYTIGYGMTECAPIVTYAAWDKSKPGSCGKVVDELEVRIESGDPMNVPGEILLKGQNVMLGYYRNEELTAEAFTSDGWLKTGDMGIIDSDGYIFIKGRCKSMLLGPSGQNIYPEEIESALNSMPSVAESLVVDQGGKLTALIFPNAEQFEDANVNVEEYIKAVVDQVNSSLPNYSRIENFKIMEKEFEKTPKKSIKRFLYQK